MNSVTMAKPQVEFHSEVHVHSVESEYQNGMQEICVLLPGDYSDDRKYRVLYVLPVEAGFEKVYGYGLGVLEEMDAQNKYGIIIVQMGFEKIPWFGDHAGDPKIRQASYVKEFVVPFIEKRYSAVNDPAGRMLLGFSKSGWGAFSLIFTYPECFGYAAAWDAPMLLDDLHFAMGQVYGTREQLDLYRPGLLIPRQKRFFQKKCRLVLAGETAWGKSIPAPGGGSHTEEAHELLEKEGVKHVFIDNLNVPHVWDKSWLAPALGALVKLDGKD